MKTTIIATALALALPIALAQPVTNTNTWTINACGNIFTGTGSNNCTTVSCAAGQTVDFGTSTGRPIELSLYSDSVCRDEITHFAGNETDYVLQMNLLSFLVLN
ncbi:hypothetical protein BDW59DRAFT_165184 [Aspergillus cavernicola]|uniref:Uncharacterized protein n=1 Tax=Aspergillus cavernicola TaxID=176166 RepID=A0ABR4HU65_9EURO